MARIMAIDYGTKRCGLAVTDPLQIVPGGLAAVATSELFAYIERYLNQEEVESIVIGEPLHADGTPTQLHAQVVGLRRKLLKAFPGLRVVLQDERYTSAEAREVIRLSGARRKKRRDKALVDQVSAVLILRDYLEERGRHA